MLTKACKIWRKSEFFSTPFRASNKTTPRKLSFVVYKLSAMEAVESCSVIKFLSLKGQTLTEIHQQMVEVYAEKCSNYSALTHWVRKFQSGFLSVIDEPREGRPASVVTEKNVSTVEKLVNRDRRITVKQLASETRISVGSVEKILHDHLNLNKESARWVPRLLTADQKRERAVCCKHLLRLETKDQLFFQKIVTMDETWIYQFDPEPKNASMQWKRPSSPPTKESKGHTIKWQGHAVLFLEQ